MFKRYWMDVYNNSLASCYPPKSNREDTTELVIVATCIGVVISLLFIGLYFI